MNRADNPRLYAVDWALLQLMNVYLVFTQSTNGRTSWFTSARLPTGGTYSSTSTSYSILQ